ncbi:thioesterase family protein [Arthrobacter agilis]|uniref:thioesterase family protein n=1 Tax=Arthrobacter agilis TaxID=37921 RepID=UPI002365E843|nr:thioesterase family protein [Arthrobacter agilis]WDF34655.1 thioesterase family protein [Arthrobacter agilis]
MHDSFYRDLGDGRFASTVHAQGAWNPREQHMAPISGLLTQCLLDHEPRAGMQLSRLSFDILGMIPEGEFEISTTVVRPGRTIELLEARMEAAGRTAIIARAWRLSTQDTVDVAAIEDPRIPGPDEAGPHEGMTAWPGGFIRSLEVRVVPGHRPGRGQVWIRNPFAMLDGRRTPDVVRLVGMMDAANGIASRVTPGGESWMFPNVDLQIHLHREPAGEWLGLDTRVTFGANGVGLTSSVVHDLAGPFGRLEQILTIRKL